MASPSTPKTKTEKALYFNVDKDKNFVYTPFHLDFGPFNLSTTHFYCQQVKQMIEAPEFKEKKIIHHTSSLSKQAQANACFLMGAFMVIVLDRGAEEAWNAFETYHDELIAFRDAAKTEEVTYKCEIYHCLKGLEIAIRLKWYSFENFDAEEYKHFLNIENGDLSWIIPGKFVAFSAPHRNAFDEFGIRQFTARDYVPIFKKWGVQVVVRLNTPTYEDVDFESQGIRVVSLYFKDGTTP